MFPVLASSATGPPAALLEGANCLPSPGALAKVEATAGGQDLVQVQDPQVCLHDEVQRLVLVVQLERHLESVVRQL